MIAPQEDRFVLTANAITHLPHHHFAVVHLLPNADDTGPGGARLFVALGDEEGGRIDVYLGETFPIGEQVWRLDEVVMPENRRFTATVTRVG